MKKILFIILCMILFVGVLPVFSVGADDSLNTGWLWPVPNQHHINSPYIDSTFPESIKKKRSSHSGIDIPPSSSRLVVAARAGKVVRVDKTGTNGGWPCAVIIEHQIGSKKYYSGYWHLKSGSVLVNKGDTVYQGQPIGTQGNTGAADGVHLHFIIGTSYGSNMSSQPYISGYFNVNPKDNSVITVSGSKYTNDEICYGGTISYTENTINIFIASTIDATMNSDTDYTLYVSANTSSGKLTEIGVEMGTSETNLTKLGSDAINASNMTAFYNTTKYGRTLTKNQTYYYRAYAINSSGQRTYGEVRSFVCGSSTTTTVTTGEAKKISDTEYTLYATASTSSGTLTEVGMEMGTSTNNLTKLGSDSINKSSVNAFYNTAKFGRTLTEGTTYYYRAYAIDSSGQRANGQILSFTTPSVSAPTNLVASTDKSTYLVSEPVTFSLSASGATKYAVSVWDGGEFGQGNRVYNSGYSSTGTFTFKPSAAGVYGIGYQAENDAGKSITVHGTFTVISPTLSAAVNKDGSVTLSINCAEPNAGWYWRIYRSTDSAFTNSVTPSRPSGELSSWTDTETINSPNTTFYYKIQPLSRDGTWGSVHSNVVSVKTPNAYSVSFAANGGGGTMESKTVTEGSSFTLPVCTFTAPGGKQFKAWSVAGKEYAAGKGITVTGDTTVTAIWEDIPAKDEYRVDALTIHSTNGAALSAIPKGPFLVTIPVTKLTDNGDALVMLASYSADGKYQGLLYVGMKNATKDATVELTLPVDNTDGSIAQLKAFTIKAFGSFIPLGTSVSFPAS